MCDSQAGMENAQKCYRQSTRMAKKAEVVLREKQKKKTNKRMESAGKQGSRKWKQFISIRALHFSPVVRISVLWLCGAMGDLMQSWSDWIINVYIHSSKPNELSMIRPAQIAVVDKDKVSDHMALLSW